MANGPDAIATTTAHEDSNDDEANMHADRPTS